MSISERSVYGQRIKQGRILRGFSQEQLGKKIGVTRQAISNCEKDIISLNTANLLKLSEILELPLSFFYKQPPIENNSDKVIFFRSKDIPKKTKEQLREEINIFDKEVVKYFEQYVKLPKLNLPDLSNILKNGTYNYKKETIMEVCKKIREHWGLGNKPIDNLAYILQANGFIISRQYIDQDKTDAFSQKIDNNYIFISGNKECAVRSRFDLAHELGHLILHDSLEIDEFEDKIIEKDADLFASEFLYPSEVFLEDIQDYSLGFERFIELKEKWKVSIQLLVRKCKDLGVISEEKYIYFQKRISFNRWRKKEPLDDRIVLEKPRLFEDVIELLIEENVLTKKDILMNIDLEKKDIIKYCNLEDDFFEDTFYNIVKIY